MASIIKYKAELYQALIRQLEAYEERLKKNPKRNHKHIALKEVGKYSAAAAAAGAAIGTVVPGIGNGIGAAAGTVAGIIVAGCMEMNYRRQNKKINNAGKIKDSFKYRTRDILKAIANEVIDERTELIKELQDIPRNEKYVAKYLAANIMAAIKHGVGRKDEPLLEVAVNGLQHPRSDKVRSHKLKKVDGSSITLAKIARNQFLLFADDAVQVKPKSSTAVQPLEKEVKTSLIKRNKV